MRKYGYKRKPTIDKERIYLRALICQETVKKEVLEKTSQDIDHNHKAVLLRNLDPLS